MKQYRIIQFDMAKELAHGICVSNLAYRVARELGMTQEECHELALAGMVHDVGKLELEKYIYGRGEDTLTIEVMKYVRSHSGISYAILNEQGGYSQFVLDSVLYHHENYDGTGYPSNLMEEEIPIGARIIRVCDVFAALISDRPYRKSFDMDTAVELMIEEVKNFDMKIFLAFMRVLHEDGIEEIADPKVYEEMLGLKTEEEEK